MQRDLTQLIADLVDRARPGATSKNAVLVILELIAENLIFDASGGAFSLDGVSTLDTPPWYAAPSGHDGYAGLCQASTVPTNPTTGPFTGVGGGGNGQMQPNPQRRVGMPQAAGGKTSGGGAVAL